MNLFVILCVGALIGVLGVMVSNALHLIFPWWVPISWERAYVMGVIVEIATRVTTIQKQLRLMQQIQDHKYLSTSDGPCGYLIRRDPPQWCGKSKEDHRAAV